MNTTNVQNELRQAEAKLRDLRRAAEAGIHRNELIVAARQTMETLTRLRDETPDSAIAITRVLDRYDKLVTELIN
jgi:hypothetical protein